MTAPQVPINPIEPPQRSDPLNYDVKADAMMIYIPPMVDGINEVANFVNEKSEESLASSISSELSSQASQAAANYEDQWSGTSIKGRSYLYNGEIYLALQNSTTTPSNDGVNWLQTLASVRQSWSSLVGYALGHRSVVSGQQYVAVQPSGPNNGGAVNPSTDSDWSHWKPVWALNQVENRLKGNQNWNIPGRTGHPLPDATPRDYPAGAEIAYGREVYLSAHPVISCTYTDEEISADSGRYRVRLLDKPSSGFVGVKLSDGRVIEAPTGSDKLGSNGIWHDTVAGIFYIDFARFAVVYGTPRGAHKFVGCSELPGVWPDVSDEESANAVSFNKEYASIPIGAEIAFDTPPPTDDPRFRFVKLTYNDSYNSGVLTSQTLSGSAPELVSTAIISTSLSPINGQTIDLINTMGTFIRPGVTAGVLKASQNKSHTHDVSQGGTAGVGVYLQRATSFAGTYTQSIASGEDEANPYCLSRVFYKRIY